MRIKLTVLAALLALCASSAYAATSVQNGQSTRGVQQLDLVGGIHSDSTGAVLTMSSTGSTITAEASPLNEKIISAAVLYDDTLSWNGRSLDSTSVVSGIGNYRVINLGLKLYGAWGAAAATYRIGVTCIMSHSSLASDTVFSFVVMPDVDTRTLTVAAQDSTGTQADGVTTTNSVGTVIAGHEVLVRLMARGVVSNGYEPYRTHNLTYYNPGYEYVRWRFRVITEPVDTDAGATKRQTFGLRAVLGGRVL